MEVETLSSRPWKETHLSTEGQVIAQVLDVVFQQEDQALVETVVFTLHVRVPVKGTDNATCFMTTH